MAAVITIQDLVKDFQHDPDIAAYANRTLHMKDGHLQQDGDQS